MNSLTKQSLQHSYQHTCNSYAFKDCTFQSWEVKAVAGRCLQVENICNIAWCRCTGQEREVETGDCLSRSSGATQPGIHISKQPRNPVAIKMEGKNQQSWLSSDLHTHAISHLCLHSYTQAHMHTHHTCTAQTHTSYMLIHARQKHRYVIHNLYK